jgi:hypothetical protein
MIKYLLLTFFVLVGFSNNSIAQFDGFSHEVGVITGPIALQSDYGERNDLKTNVGNTGVGIGIVDYLNFAFDSSCLCYTPMSFFNNHFKLRSELSYSYIELKHFGYWVDKNNGSSSVEQLRGMRANTHILNAGMQLEFYPLSVRDFTTIEGSFGPYVSLGAQFSFYNPDTYSLMGPLGTVQNTYPNYLTPSDGQPHGYTSDSGNVFSVVSSVGTRYKLSPISDVLVDLRFQYFNSNWIDGLNPNADLYKGNRSKDWLVWFSVGYIYYMH